MAIRILVDSSFIYATYNEGDSNHIQAIDFAAKSQIISIAPDVILPEVCFLFERDFGHYAISKFLAAFYKSGITLQPILMDDVKRAQEIMTQYPEAELDFVDCCIMALAERLNITQVCTFDRRDFSIFRPAHCDYLELLP